MSSEQEPRSFAEREILPALDIPLAAEHPRALSAVPQSTPESWTQSSDYLALPAKVRLASADNAWLVVWDDCKVWWEYSWGK